MKMMAEKARVMAAAWTVAFKLCMCEDPAMKKARRRLVEAFEDYWKLIPVADGVFERGYQPQNDSPLEAEDLVPPRSDTGVVLRKKG